MHWAKDWLTFEHALQGACISHESDSNENGKKAQYQEMPHSLFRGYDNIHMTGGLQK